MKNYFKGTFHRYAFMLICFALGSFLLVSCDDYLYDNKEPDWLGASIYDYLKSDGHFDNYAKLVEDLDYTDVLSKTGSKTLFVANDSAFNEFYKSNPWGVHNYDQLTLSQKKLILNYGMIDNAYLVGMLANYYNGGLKENAAFRRTTAISVIDSLPFVPGSTLPEGNYWNNYRFKGMFLLRDNTPWTLACLTQKFLEQALITDEDFNTITGLTRVKNDAHVFGDKIIKQDVTCKNGYLNVLDKLMVPPMNMAEYITGNSNLSTFSKLLERFSAPYFDKDNTILYKQLHPEFTDSIFNKKYFAKLSGDNQIPSGVANNRTPDNTAISSDMLLPFDPGWNRYTRNNALESDMAAMFVPTNEAMANFFNSGAGAVLKDRFKTWDSVPTDILPLFLKRHMRSSFIESVPSRFANMVDEDNSLLPVTKADIHKVYMGSNGLVYETNNVYPPDDYNSVYGPVLLSANDVSVVNKTKIWKWAINQNDFRLYLNSMVSKYSFFVPTDEYFTKYVEPVSMGKDVPGALKFWYNSKTSAVNATVYKFNKTTGLMTDSVALITDASYLVNRLLDILNMHIVVGDVESGKDYYLTKGNVAIKVAGTGEGLKVEAGENMKLNEKVNVTKAYNQSNGKTYFIDKPIQAPMQSVYKVLSETPEFSSFFSLLAGFPSTSNSVVFVSKTNYFGIDFNVKFFNTFNYTVYVPTNSAIDSAIVHGIIKPWESQGSIVGINALTSATEKNAAILNLERFIRYHFQDNSVFVDGKAYSGVYQSATMKLDAVSTHFGTFKNKYYKIGVDNNQGITLTTENNGVAHVVTTPGLFNIMTRDYVFSAKPSTFKNLDGTGAGNDFKTSMIYTSSTAVVHQIDKVLNFQ